MRAVFDEPVPPFDLVLFGGTGDLAMRKLLPSLYFRHFERQLPDEGRIICSARAEMDTDGFRSLMREEALPHIDESMLTEEAWASFVQRVEYLGFDATRQDSYDQLQSRLEGHEARVRVFYLSVAPSLFAPICKNVHEAGLVNPLSRVALEKPLGRDQSSAEQINDALAATFNEEQIFRIDHYLGKETVQNLLALRFGNVLFEPLWRREMISDVQITIAETLGVEGRAGFYDQTGALRDMVQNHLLQLLVIIAMEPPASSDPDALRDEKIKVLRALKPLAGRDAVENSVRGQYKAGTYSEGKVPGYLDSDDVPADSTTETFVALRAEIASWRWEGVPFFLRTGKRLEGRVTEIIINFRQVPHSIFSTASGLTAPNQLVIRLQPEESVQLRVYAKAWGDQMHLQPVSLNLDFNDVFHKRKMIAYERLLMDVLRGNPTLFMRRDEVAAAWAWIDPIREAWEDLGGVPKPYAAGSWGPGASHTLISREGLNWSED